MSGMDREDRFVDDKQIPLSLRGSFVDMINHSFCFACFVVDTKLELGKNIMDDSSE